MWLLALVPAHLPHAASAIATVAEAISAAALAATAKQPSWVTATAPTNVKVSVLHNKMKFSVGDQRKVEAGVQPPPMLPRLQAALMPPQPRQQQ